MKVSTRGHLPKGVAGPDVQAFEKKILKDLKKSGHATCHPLLNCAHFARWLPPTRPPTLRLRHRAANPGHRGLLVHGIIINCKKRINLFYSLKRTTP